MKKARLMLTGIAITALVAGAFAFKAQKKEKGNTIWCTTFLTLNPNLCNQFNNSTFALNPAGLYWCTGVFGAACTFQGTIAPMQ